LAKPSESDAERRDLYQGVAASESSETGLDPIAAALQLYCCVLSINNQPPLLFAHHQACHFPLPHSSFTNRRCNPIGRLNRPSLTVAKGKTQPQHKASIWSVHVPA